MRQKNANETKNAKYGRHRWGGHHHVPHVLHEPNSTSRILLGFLAEDTVPVPVRATLFLALSAVGVHDARPFACERGVVEDGRIELRIPLPMVCRPV